MARAALLLGAWHAAPDTTRLTLDSCLRIAQQNATIIQLSAADVRLSGIEVLRGYGAFLPAADVTSGYTRQGGTTFLSQSTTIPTTATFSVVGYHLSAALNLFNGFRDRADLDGALAARDAATWTLARARQQVEYDVTQAFLQAVLDRQLVGIARQNLALSQARQSELEALVQVGRRPPPDLFRQEAQTSADQVALVDATDREQQDQIALILRLRLPSDGVYALQVPPDDTVPLSAGLDSITALAAIANHRRPDLLAAVANQHESDALLAAARGGRLPRVDLGFDLFGVARVFDQELQNGVSLLPATQRELWSQLFPQTAYSLTLGVTWHAFDRFATRLDIERAAVNQESAELEYQDLKNRIGGEVRVAVAEYHAATDRLAAAQSGLTAADTAFAALQARFDAGLSTFVDVITAQTALTQARAAHADATIRFALAKRILALAIGSSDISQ